MVRSETSIVFPELRLNPSESSLWLINSEQKLTTETPRTQKLHRESAIESAEGAQI